jgi:metal-dependent amidase/aminoacylase/carboxypeptidase family protein
VSLAEVKSAQAHVRELTAAGFRITSTGTAGVPTAFIADGAAAMTQTKAEFDLFFGMYDLMPSQPLVDLSYRHLQAIPLEWTAEEQAFARACQKAMGVPEAGMATRLLPKLPDTTAGGGSTDIGDTATPAPSPSLGGRPCRSASACTPGPSRPAAACRSARPRSTPLARWPASAST